MVILYLEWNSYGNEDMFAVLKRMGHKVIRMPFSGNKDNEYYKFEDRMDEIINQNPVDFVFSFNYYPPVSIHCQKRNLKYVAWVYDSPYVNVYSYTLINPCNYVFLFDRAFYMEFKSQGINTVYYLPLAVNVDRLDQMIPAESTKQILDTDIAFVGSLYTEEKHNLYQRFEKVSPFAKGYLDGIIQAQLKVYGYNFIQEVLAKDVIEEMKKVHLLHSNTLSVETDEYVYGDYVLSRQVTAIERREILEMLSQKYSVQLHTNDENAVIGNVQNMGLVDYYDGMPYVFKCAKINLNITLRSIKSGIPLRALDIMGCGGFLITNYQEEFLDYFIPDEDFVFYSDYDDLMSKVEYYLNHEEERKRIAKNGHDKVKKYHTFEHRLQEMIKIVSAQDERNVEVTIMNSANKVEEV